MGLFAVFLNKASFSGLFSTILRTGKSATLSASMDNADCYGHDPLPSRLRRSTMTFAAAQLDGEHYKLVSPGQTEDLGEEDRKQDEFHLSTLPVVSQQYTGVPDMK
ncbi:hypothetical protein K431DRAFT_308281 [Polychaeton citri CBS 116435]|uniref:Uncharacterized protein n=1 Tax=Polychaeton citri CBS 116435 TaxID=1314669 RepID=A0A9P4UJ01_9PEZI|nr:hypothetical protein K431DRAFT_308281 [Polychaeton citri CBS 116435]